MYLLHTRKAPVRPHPLQHATDTTTEPLTSNQRLPVTKGVQEVRAVLDRLPHTSQHTISGSELKLELERAATHLGWPALASCSGLAACASVSHLLGYLQVLTFQLQEPPSGHRRPHQVAAPEMRNRPDLHSDGKLNWPTWSCHFATAKASPAHRSNRPAENNPPNHRGLCHQSSEKGVPTRQNQVWQAAHFAKSASLSMDD